MRIVLTYILFIVNFVYVVNAGELNFKQVEFLDDSTKQIEFILKDKFGEQITDINNEDFKLIENYNTIIKPNIICNEVPQNEMGLSSFLMIDVSGSMQGTGMEIAKNISNLWVDLLKDYSNDYECGIGEFNGESKITQAFTNSTFKLCYAINTLTPDGGTNFFNAFLSNSGAIEHLSKGRFKKKLLFLTDGLADINASQVIQLANLYNIEIYCIVLNNNLPKSLEVISQATGGKAYGNVNSIFQAREIYNEFFNIVKHNYIYCKLKWVSKTPCSFIKIIYNNKEYNLNYSPLSNTINPYLDIENNIIEINKNLTNLNINEILSYEVKNGNIQIDTIIFPEYVVGKSKFNYPFEIENGENLVIDISIENNSEYFNRDIKILTSCEEYKVTLLKREPDPIVPPQVRYGFGTTAILTDITKSNIPNFKGFNSGFGLQFYISNSLALKLSYGIIEVGKDININDITNNINLQQSAGANLRINLNQNQQIILYTAPGIVYRDYFIDDKFNDGWTRKNGNYLLTVNIPIGVEWFFTHNITLSLQYDINYSRYFNKNGFTKGKSIFKEEYLGNSVGLNNFPTISLSYYIN